MSGGEVVAWCELTPSGNIAFFDGKPMIMIGPVGNEHHTTPLVLQSDLAAAIARAEAAEAALAEYANPKNWGDYEGRHRVWIEPESDTPDAYNGYELAQAAIAAQQAEGEDRG